MRSTRRSTDLLLAVALLHRPVAGSFSPVKAFFEWFASSDAVKQMHARHIEGDQVMHMVKGSPLASAPDERKLEFARGPAGDAVASFMRAEQQYIGGWKVRKIVEAAGESFDPELERDKLVQEVGRNMVVVFSFVDCPWCLLAKETLEAIAASDDPLLSDGDVRFVELEDLRHDGKRLRAAIALATSRTSMPAIFIGGKSIGGYTDGDPEGDPELCHSGSPGLERLIETGGLRRLLSIRGGGVVPSLSNRRDLVCRAGHAGLAALAALAAPVAGSLAPASAVSASEGGRALRGARGRVALRSLADVGSSLGDMAMWPDPVLRTVASPVLPEDFGQQQLQRVCEMLVDRMESRAVAAIQYGVDAQIIALRGDSSPMADGAPLVLVNPRILERSAETLMRSWREICLVLPEGIEIELLRDAWVSVEAERPDGTTFRRTLRGEPARAFQHEFDHLRGTLIIDAADLDELPAQMRDVELEEHAVRQRRAFERPDRLPARTAAASAIGAGSLHMVPAAGAVDLAPAPGGGQAGGVQGGVDGGMQGPKSVPSPQPKSSPPAGSGAMGPVLLALFLGGGLVPSLADANSQAFSKLSGGEGELDQVTPARSKGGAELACSPLLFYPAPLILDDVADVLSRISAGTLQLNTSRLLRRAELEKALSELPPRSEELRGKDGASLPILEPLSTPASPKPLPSLAMEAVWCAFSGGSPYVSVAEFERQVGRWRPDDGTLVMEEFEKSLLQGRAQVFLGFAVLFGLQALVLGVLVVQPLWEALASGA
jgi:peptide deformylase